MTEISWESILRLLLENFVQLLYIFQMFRLNPMSYWVSEKQCIAIVLPTAVL